MERKEFMKMIGAGGLIVGLGSVLQSLREKENTETMPALFVGHGSPMNAIQENLFTESWRNIGKRIPKPSAILCVSAHWLTRGTYVTAMEKPKTIYDFGGFPDELFQVKYPASGSPSVAKETQELVKTTSIQLDTDWGLDHGTWSFLKHMYPDADIPVLQFSIDYSKPASYHYELGKELQALRNKGVLLIGSGNLVHNLGMVAWDKMEEVNFGFDWALECNALFKEKILLRDIDALTNYSTLHKFIHYAIPTPDHYFPFIYQMAWLKANEKIEFFNDYAVAGSLTMTSVALGLKD
jgi:4,5-DOPA dioxygenase extradiol